jgi:hypothetical protein
MAHRVAHRRLRKAFIAGVLIGIVAITLAGGLVVSNALAIGDSIGQQAEPTTKVPPVAHRRWYARAEFFAPEGAASPVPIHTDNRAED